MSDVLTGLILIILLLMYLMGLENNNDDFDMMSYGNSQPVKFIFAIIIIFVHIPLMYQNRVQDLIGSFAFIGVSFFDLSSAYGLKISCDRKANYLKLFWPKRSFDILVPLIFIAIVDIVYSIGFSKEINVFKQYKNIYGWILVLIEFYFTFWLVYKLSTKCSFLNKYKDLIICLIVLALSVTDYCFNENIIKGWSLERLGFIAGIILYNHKDKFILWAIDKTFIKIIFTCFATAITGLLYLKTKNVFGLSYGTKALLEYSFLLFIVLWISKFSADNKLIKWGGIIRHLYSSSSNV